MPDTKKTEKYCVSIAVLSERISRANDALTAAEKFSAAALASHALSNEQKYNALESATAKAAEDIDRRLEGMNAFRDQISMERTDYVRRDMYEREHDALSERSNVLELHQSNVAGRTAAYTTVVGLVFLALQVALHFFSAWK